MVQGIGGGSLSREAIEAALQSQSRSAQKIADAVSNALGEAPGGGAESKKTEFGSSLSGALLDGVREVDGKLKEVDRLPEALVRGEITDFHEVAGRLKKADLAFKFSLEVRNKLIDAYRETMRMSV